MSAIFMIVENMNFQTQSDTESFPRVSNADFAFHKRPG